MNLVIFNYSMSSRSQLFSHQREIAFALSEFFDTTYVITSNIDSQEDSSEIKGKNIIIISTNWQPGRYISNLWNFYAKTLPILFLNRRQAVFSHMTDVQSLLIAPFCSIFRIRHTLWYAHTSPSLFLFAAYPFLDKILTSTPGSCPLTGRKVRAIGQSVDSARFSLHVSEPNFPPKNWYHVGRLDPSKNIHVIIEALSIYWQKFPDITLDLYGAPSSNRNDKYFEFLKNFVSEKGYDRWVNFKGLTPNSNIQNLANRYDGFIHAYCGSLDKALIEAILSKRIVVSSNPEYQFEFRNAHSSNNNISFSLSDELSRVFTSSEKAIREEITNSELLALRKHTLHNWLRMTVSLLKTES